LLLVRNRWMFVRRHPDLIGRDLHGRSLLIAYNRFTRTASSIDAV